MASASMDDDIVRTNATNFRTAMVRFAARAATIALVPPLAATKASPLRFWESLEWARKSRHRDDLARNTVPGVRLFLHSGPGRPAANGRLHRGKRWPLYPDSSSRLRHRQARLRG